MKKRLLYILAAGLLLSACQPAREQPTAPEIPASEPEDISSSEALPDIPGETTELIDPGSYFDNINGCAVFYTPSTGCWQIYNEELAGKASSPCSTFKVISTLFGLETGVIDPTDSVRSWNGTEFWNTEWNRDIGLEDAFHASCIWYFREVIDEIGADTMQQMLEDLDYGNADISDWEGLLNTNNSYMELRGFWVESSLEISPMNQAEVMARIFDTDSIYDEAHIALLKQIMLTDASDETLKIYGKTGMGMKNGACIDAWFTGLYEKDGVPVYFSIRLDDPDNPESSSTKAKEIAIAVIQDYF